MAVTRALPSCGAVPPAIATLIDIFCECESIQWTQTQDKKMNRNTDRTMTLSTDPLYSAGPSSQVATMITSSHECVDKCIVPEGRQALCTAKSRCAEINVKYCTKELGLYSKELACVGCPLTNCTTPCLGSTTAYANPASSKRSRHNTKYLQQSVRPTPPRLTIHCGQVAESHSLASFLILASTVSSPAPTYRTFEYTDSPQKLNEVFAGTKTTSPTESVVVPSKPPTSMVTIPSTTSSAV